MGLLTRRGGRIVDPELQILAMLLSHSCAGVDEGGHQWLHGTVRLCPELCFDVAKLVVKSGTNPKVEMAVNAWKMGGWNPAAMAVFGDTPATKPSWR